MKLLEEPLYIELIAIAVLAGVLLFRAHVRGLRSDGREPLDEGLVRGVCDTLEGRHGQATETLEQLPRSELREAWLARIAYESGDLARALDLLRGSRRLTPERMTLELIASRGEPGAVAAEEMLAQARRLPHGGVRSSTEKLRVFASLGVGADLAQAVARAPVGVPQPLLARAVTSAIRSGQRVPDAVLRRHGIPGEVALRARAVDDPQRRPALLEDFANYGRVVALLRDDLPLPEHAEIDRVWNDLQALEPIQAASGSASRRDAATFVEPEPAAPSVTTAPAQPPGVGGLEALADGPFERLAEALTRWSAGPLRGALADTLCRAAARRGPRLLVEIQEDARCRSNLDRVRLAALTLAAHPVDRDSHALHGFARLELSAAIWVLSPAPALEWFLARPEDLWSGALEHPRPAPLTLLCALVRAPLASRALEVLRARTDLLAEALTRGLEDPSGSELVEHLARVAPAEVAASLLRRLLSQDDVQDEARVLFGLVGRDAVNALMSCVGSEALEIRALGFAPYLSGDAKSWARQLASDAEHHGDRRSSMFLSRIAGDGERGGA